jgi:hypothetical protein
MDRLCLIARQHWIGVWHLDGESRRWQPSTSRRTGTRRGLVSGWKLVVLRRCRSSLQGADHRRIGGARETRSDPKRHRPRWNDVVLHGRSHADPSKPWLRDPCRVAGGRSVTGPCAHLRDPRPAMANHQPRPLAGRKMARRAAHRRAHDQHLDGVDIQW